MPSRMAALHADDAARVLCLATLTQASKQRPAGKPMAELRLPSGEWLSNFYTTFIQRNSYFATRLTLDVPFSTLVSALLAGLPAGAPAGCDLFMEADPQQLQQAAAAAEDATVRPPAYTISILDTQLNAAEVSLTML